MPENDCFSNGDNETYNITSELYRLFNPLSTDMLFPLPRALSERFRCIDKRSRDIYLGENGSKRKLRQILL